MSGRYLSALTFVAALATAPPAAALDPHIVTTESGRVSHLRGDIEPDDPGRIIGFVRAEGPFESVILESRGGSLSAGLELGDFFRSIDAVTRIAQGTICASACVYAFLGGRIRYVEQGAHVGVHRATLSSSPDLLEALADAARRGDESATSTALSVLERAAAAAAVAQTKYLVRMGVSLELINPSVETDFADIYWLDVRELKSFNVVNAF